MDRAIQKVGKETYSDFQSPVNSGQKTFLGKKLKISSDAQSTIDQLSRHEQLKFHNRLNKLVAEVIRHRLHQQKSIYIDLSGSFLKISFSRANAPYTATINKARIIQKPKALRAAPSEEKALNDCKIRTTRGLVRQIANTDYRFEKVLEPNIFTARELVNIQTLRMREHVNHWQVTAGIDTEGKGHTNTQWADVCYGAKDGFLGVGQGDEVIALSAIFGISKQTGIMHKSYFSAMKQTAIKTILHRYAVIFGHPNMNAPEMEKIQNQLEEGAASRENTIRQYIQQTHKYHADVVIHVDSNLNVHKFFRNGIYKFINCENVKNRD